MGGIFGTISKKSCVADPFSTAPTTTHISVHAEAVWQPTVVTASSMEQFNSAYAIFSMPYVFESTEQ